MLSECEVQMIRIAEDPINWWLVGPAIGVVLLSVAYLVWYVRWLVTRDW